MSSEKRFYRSGELAELAGVSSDTLRHYERKGVLARPRRKANDYRQYPVSALQRVRLIRRAIAVGFTLDELAYVSACVPREWQGRCAMHGGSGIGSGQTLGHRNSVA